MAARKKQKPDSFDQPSLFDPPMPSMPQLDLERDPLPVFPAIEEAARRAKLNGGRDAKGNVISRAADMNINRTARDSKLMFISFGSGSSGNCYYVGNGTHGVLIDAGVDAGNVENWLLHNGIDIDSISGICLTHDHSDHVASVYTILRNHRHMRLFCTPRTLNGLLRKHNVSRRLRDYHTPVYKEFSFMIGSLKITPFEVSHDGTDNAGYFIEHNTQTIAVATDLGAVTDRVDHYMRRASNIVIEANYDNGMLTHGPYPEYLKARIRSSRGHLDNEETGLFLGKIYTPALKNIFLCHLSDQNNTPEKALETVRRKLHEAGVPTPGDGTNSLDAEKHPLQLSALPRYSPSALFVLE